ncbi:MAG: class I SAM-dependent RNA methyltransferase [Gemmatimonadales bacterium]
MIEPPLHVEIAAVAAGGEGVGRIDSMAVFVPRTAPGDVAIVSLVRAKRFARGTLTSLLVSSPLRVEPTCLHYTQDRCGGCQLQHLSYAAQLEAKGRIVGDSLRRIGRRPVENPIVEPSDGQWRYRQKLTLHVRNSGAGWVAGLHPYDDPEAVFDLHECPITDDRVLAVWAELRTAFDRLPAEGALRVAVQLMEGGASVVVEGGRLWRAPESLLDRMASLVELWWRPEGGRRRLVASRTVESRRGASFAQVNAGVAVRLQEYVLGLARAHHPDRVVDAYAGTGATAIPLAADGREVVAIELDRAAAEYLRGKLGAPSTAIAGRVEDHTRALLAADVVLLNPPRAGVDARVTEALQTARRLPRAVIYTSCDPATLARDLGRLPAYRLASVRAYDMFPQTAHVETVCELVPEAA